MSAQHTPGPWQIDYGYNRIIKSIGPCVPDQYAGSAWLEVTEADARLIAAAPDLLHACRKAVIALAALSEICPPMIQEYEIVSAAIAKATGEAK